MTATATAKPIGPRRHFIKAAQEADKERVGKRRSVCVCVREMSDILYRFICTCQLMRNWYHSTGAIDVYFVFSSFFLLSLHAAILTHAETRCSEPRNLCANWNLFVLLQCDVKALQIFVWCCMSNVAYAWCGEGENKCTCERASNEGTVKFK